MQKVLLRFCVSIMFPVLHGIERDARHCSVRTKRAGDYSNLLCGMLRVHCVSPASHNSDNNILNKNQALYGFNNISKVLKNHQIEIQVVTGIEILKKNSD